MHQQGYWWAFLSLMATVLIVSSPGYAAETNVVLNHLRLTTSVDSLHVSGTIENLQSVAHGISTTIDIYDRAGLLVYHQRLPETIDIAAKSQASLKAELDNLPVDAWWPERSILYTITITLADIDSGAVLAKESVLTGFRTFTVSDGRFWLNGKPYFVRGAQYTPMFSNGANLQLVEQLQQQPSFPTSLMQYLKSAHINMTKTPYQELADSLGIMNFGNGQGGYAMAPHYNYPVAAGSALQALQNTLVQNIDVYYNHPSFVMPVFWNEADTKNAGISAYLAQLRRLMRELDPLRPAVANLGFGRGENADVDSAHWYWGYHTASSELFRVRTAGTLSELKRQSSRDLPFILTETGGNYTDENGEFPYSRTGQYPIPDFIWIGRSHQVKQDSLEYQAITVKELAEGFRRARGPQNRISGVIMFTSPFFFDGQTISPKPAYDELKQAMQPVLVSADTWKWHYYGGDTLRTGIHVVHDDIFTDLLPPGEVRIRLVSPVGVTLAATSLPTPPITYYSNWQAPLALPLPQVEAPMQAQLQLEYVTGDVVRSTNTETIFLAPHAWVQANASLNATPLALYDPSGVTAARLTEQGVTYASVTGLDDSRLAAFPALVVGVGALKSTDTSRNRDLLLQYATRGGRVLVLRQSFNTGMLLPFNVDLSSSSGLSFMNTDRTDHPLFSGLHQNDFRFWADEVGENLYTAGQGFRLKNVTDLKRVIVWGTSGAMQRDIITAEFLHGLGSMLLDNSYACSKGEFDPLAGRFCANLVNYIRAPKASGLPTLTDAVSFGNFATEQSIIVAEELQGWKVQPNRQGRTLTGGVKMALDGAMVPAGHLLFQLPAKPKSFTFKLSHAAVTSGTAAIYVNGTLLAKTSLKFGENLVTADVSNLAIELNAIQVTLALTKAETVVLGFSVD